MIDDDLLSRALQYGGLIGITGNTLTIVIDQLPDDLADEISEQLRATRDENVTLN